LTKDQTETLHKKKITKAPIIGLEIKEDIIKDPEVEMSIPGKNNEEVVNEPFSSLLKKNKAREEKGKIIS